MLRIGRKETELGVSVHTILCHWQPEKSFRALAIDTLLQPMDQTDFTTPSPTGTIARPTPASSKPKVLAKCQTNNGRKLLRLLYAPVIKNRRSTKPHKQWTQQSFEHETVRLISKTTRTIQIQMTELLFQPESEKMMSWRCIWEACRMESGQQLSTGTQEPILSSNNNSLGMNREIRACGSLSQTLTLPKVKD